MSIPESFLIKSQYPLTSTTYAAICQEKAATLSDLARRALFLHMEAERFISFWIPHLTDFSRETFDERFGEELKNLIGYRMSDCSSVFTILEEVRYIQAYFSHESTGWYKMARYKMGLINHWELFGKENPEEIYG